MPTITLSGNDYEVYVDAATADAYLAGAIYATQWAASPADTKSRAIITATRLIDKQRYKGDRYLDSQPLEWPRKNIPGVVDGTTPDAVLDACCELAYLLFDDPTTASNAPSRPDNTRRVKAGSAEVEFFQSGSSGGWATTRFPLVVQEYLAEYLAAPAVLPKSFGTGRLSVSGKDYDFTG